MIEDINTTLNRLYITLRIQMETQLPNVGGVHIYSNGNTFREFTRSTFPNITFNQLYSAYMLGFDKDGRYKGEEGARIPKPTKSNPNPKHLEKYNFGIIERCTIQASKIIAIASGGKVVNDLR